MASPRFDTTGALHYVADDQRRNPGLYVRRADGTTARIARRNSVDANAPLDADRVIYAEYERVDPYSVQSDLYRGTGRRRARLTVGARLSHPDVHPASGRIVAVHTLPGTTELVVLDSMGRGARVLASGSLDVNWSEPRWSRSGAFVAAARWERGGQMSIVVLDTAGREVRRFSPRAARGRLAVVSAPAWIPGDSLVLFASDHIQSPRLYVGDLRSGAFRPFLVEGYALRAPDVSSDGHRLAALELRADGWYVITRATPTLPDFAAAPTDGSAVDSSSARDSLARPAIDAEELSAATAQPFTPSLTAYPAWWLPAAGISDENQPTIGVMSGGRDVVGRHTWQASAMRDLTRPEWTTNVFYEYAGWGNPTLSVGWTQDWQHVTVTSGGNAVGALGLRSNTVRATLFAVRPRARLTTYAIAGAELGFESWASYPADLVSRFTEPDEFLDVDRYPRGVFAAGFSSLQRPGLSVSTEDGVAMQVTLRQRLNEGRSDVAVTEAILEANAAKSLPLPGFARHVVAVRAAYGMTSDSTRSYLSVGGVSGSYLEVLPGLSVGDPRRTFFVRGFSPAGQRGTRAAAASAEYRAPLVRVGRGVGLVPASLQKLSALVFADAGAAWCTVGITDTSCPAVIAPRRWIASVGGEIVFDTNLQYDALYRMRLGVALPVRGEVAAPRQATIYFTFGSTF